MDSNKCMSRKNIFADFNSSINIFDISKTIDLPTKILFRTIACRTIYQNYLFENNLLCG